MAVSYLFDISVLENNYSFVQVKMIFTKGEQQKQSLFFAHDNQKIFSPRKFQVQDQRGNRYPLLFEDQHWTIYFDGNEEDTHAGEKKVITVSYEIALTKPSLDQRSFLHERGAFLDLGELCLQTAEAGAVNKSPAALQVRLTFPLLWSHVLTTLKDVSKQRDLFLYECASFSELTRHHILIGCFESDGFMWQQEIPISFHEEVESMRAASSGKERKTFKTKVQELLEQQLQKMSAKEKKYLLPMWKSGMLQNPHLHDLALIFIQADCERIIPISGGLLLLGRDGQGLPKQKNEDLFLACLKAIWCFSLRTAAFSRVEKMVMNSYIEALIWPRPQTPSREKLSLWEMLTVYPWDFSLRETQPMCVRAQKVKQALQGFFQKVIDTHTDPVTAIESFEKWFEQSAAAYQNNEGQNRKKRLAQGYDESLQILWQATTKKNQEQFSSDFLF